jgi:hypothetical protein
VLCILSYIQNDTSRFRIDFAPPTTKTLRMTQACYVLGPGGYTSCYRLKPLDIQRNVKFIRLPEACGCGGMPCLKSCWCRSRVRVRVRVRVKKFFFYLKRIQNDTNTWKRPSIVRTSNGFNSISRKISPLVLAMMNGRVAPTEKLTMFISSSEDS